MRDRIGLGFKIILALDWVLLAAAGAALLAGDEELMVVLLAVTGVIALFCFPIGLWFLTR